MMREEFQRFGKGLEGEEEEKRSLGCQEGGARGAEIAVLVRKKSEFSKRWNA